MLEIVLPATPDRQTFDRLTEALRQTGPLILRFAAVSEFARDHLPAYRQPEADLRRWSEVARELETREPGAVAWLEQDVTGLWFELALACRQRLLAKPYVRFWFPAVRFGLLAALGGGQRLIRLLPPADAISVLLRGKPLGGERAGQLGFAQVIPATELADLLQIPLNPQPWDRPQSTGLIGPSAEHLQVLNSAFLELRSRTPPEDRAPTALLRALHEGSQRTFEAAIKLEQAEFFRTRETPSTRNRLRLLVEATAKAKAQGQPSHELTAPAVGVIGAGLMGSGIAYAASRAGCEVFVIDESSDALERSNDRITRLAQSVALQGKDIATLLARIHRSLDFQTLSAANVVIEAVFERLEVKSQVLSAASRVLRPRAILASNTTTLPISRLAEFVAEPSRFLGTHFFAPVHRMDLLELIRGQQTSGETINQALRLAAWLGKTPLLVNDAPGFFTSRVVMAYVQEAFFLLEEGVDPWLIDHVALNAGMVIGPLVMADLTSLDLLLDIYRSLAQGGRGAARDAGRTVSTLERMVGLGRLGKKTRAGVYDYDDQGEQQPWVGLREVFPAKLTGIVPELIHQRLFFIQSLEAAHARNEGVISDPDLGDLAAVLGWNYPTHLGGPFGYIDLVSRDAFVLRCQELTATCGKRFQLPW